MPNKKKSLRDMTTKASVLGWTMPPSEWPKTFEAGMQVWTLDHVTMATQTGEVQCAEYRDGHDWMIVINE